MTNKGYTTVSDPDTSAKALGKELPISPKLAREVCGMIRGMKVDKAIKALEDVMALKRPVPLKRYNKRVSHKQGVGPGRYPEKAAEAILKVIQTIGTADGKTAIKNLCPPEVTYQEIELVLSVL